MEHVLACIDSSVYTAPVCQLAAWAAKRLDLPVELLHVVQRTNPVAERHDLSGAIGLGVKADLLEELTRLEEAAARIEIEKGRVLLETGKRWLRDAGIDSVQLLHRHGGIVETILEREAGSKVVVIGKRGAGHEFAPAHLGSRIERVVRASQRPILIASRAFEPPQSIVLAVDGSPASRNALECCATSALLADLPVRVITVGPDTSAARDLLSESQRTLGNDRDVRTTLRTQRAEEAIGAVVEATPGAVLVMGAYSHSPLHAFVAGSTTTAMIRTVHVPVLLIR